MEDLFENWFKKVIAPMAIVAVGFAVLVCMMVLTFPDEIASRTEVRAGVVVDKEFVGPSEGLFRHKPAKYYITIESDYELEFGALTQSGTTTKTISVDKETYLEAEMGMWFDIRTMEATTEEPKASFPDSA